MNAEFLALREQQLQPQADAEERLTGCDGFPDRLDQPVLFQVGHAVGKGADARQDDMAGVRDRMAVTRDDGLVSDRFKGLLHAPEIPHAVVDDGNHRDREP